MVVFVKMNKKRFGEKKSIKKKQKERINQGGVSLTLYPSYLE